MKQIEFSDAVAISGTRTTNDGYLVADCRVARTGIQEYMGYELGDGKDASKVYRIYRPEDEVFKKDALQSYAYRPITLGHPPEGVTADNWKKEAIGTVGGDVARDGDYIRVPMMIADSGAIKSIADGTRQISMGYSCSLDWTPGTAPDGTAYDAIQRDLRMNHAAIVPAGRAGPECRLGDASRARTSNQKDNTTMTKTVTIDGKEHQVTDEVAAHLAKLQADNKAQADTLKDAVTQIDAAKVVIAAAKTDREAAEKAAADAKALSDKAAADKKATEDVQKTAAELIDTMEKAKRLVPALDVKGKSADAIKKEAVSQKLGDKAVEGKDAAFFDAAFVMLTKDTGDPVADALKGGPSVVADAGDKAFLDYKAELSKAWQTPVAKN